jgi:AraC-like DNA-binding protein
LSVLYREIEPRASLRPLVHRIWLLRGVPSSGERDFQRAMPDGRAEIIFNLAEPFESRCGAGVVRQPASLLVGPTTRAMELRPSGQVDLIGVRLQPGAAPYLLGATGREMLDRAVDLDEPRPRWTRGLAERLSGCMSAAERVRAVEEALLRSAGPAEPRLAAAVRLALRAGGPVRVGGIAELVGLSRRHLTRLHRERVGFGPKLLGRLSRFQRVLRELEDGRLPRWGALAQRHGYFDQAHLIRDFRQFAGISPGRYLSAAREVTRHFVDRELPARD